MSPHFTSGAISLSPHPDLLVPHLTFPAAPPFPPYMSAFYATLHPCIPCYPTSLPLVLPYIPMSCATLTCYLTTKERLKHEVKLGTTPTAVSALFSSVSLHLNFPSIFLSHAARQPIKWLQFVYCCCLIQVSWVPSALYSHVCSQAILALNKV